MAVSKRTRFEVLRRDDHTCRYCGGRAPDVTLTVDHVIPRSLGGSDAPDNLVAACRDCNAGKSSTSPDEKTVADVSTEAVALGKALREALRLRGQALAEATSWVENVGDWWDESAGHAGVSWARMDDGWEDSVRKWYGMGVPANVITDAIDTAMRRRKVSASSKWRYACGIIWRTLDDAMQDVLPRAEEPKRCGHCCACTDESCREFEGHCMVYNPTEDEEKEPCRVCGDPRCLYQAAHEDGIDCGMQWEFSRWYDAIKHYRTCPEVKREP